MTTKSKNNPETQRRYYKKWYAKNKKKLAARRKDRYRNDPEYREKLKKQARDRLRRQRKPGGEE